MKVKFLFDQKYRTAKAVHRPGEMSYDTTHYKAGETYDLDENQAAKWVNRGVAKEAPASAPPARAEKTTEPFKGGGK